MALEIERGEQHTPRAKGKAMHRRIFWAVVELGETLAEFDTPQEARAFSRGLNYGEERLRRRVREL